MLLSRISMIAPRPSLILAISATIISACTPTIPCPLPTTENALVIYVDGAGGAATTSPSVCRGLATGGYTGTFRVFDWSTGLGLLADHAADMSYKRARAADLAGEIVAFRDERPSDRLAIVAFSAGTTIAALALEALPPPYRVDTLVFIESSLASDYDLSPALRHLSGRAHVFTSDRDEYLAFGVPLAGTADRRFCGFCAAGLRGFSPPANADEATLRLYERIDMTAWRPEFAEYGHFGRHYDATAEPFVAAFIAPLLLPGPSFP